VSLGRICRALAWLALWQLHAGPAAAQLAGPLQVAPGVFVVPGSLDAASPANRGAVGNAGFIATPAGTVVVNTGGSLRLGEALLAAAERTTRRRVVLAVITQAQPEFLMGAAAFSARGIEIVAHEATARAMAGRCIECLRRLRQTLGEAEMAGTRLVAPTRQVTASLRVAPGGRRIDILFFGAAQTEGDLVVVDRQTGTAFAGALVGAGRIPQLEAHGEAAPWRAVLARLAEQPLRTLVPGYGAPGPPGELIAATDAYLRALEQQVQALMQEGAGLAAAARRAPLPPWQGWAQYDGWHARNVQRQYLAAELRWLGQAASAPTDARP
jgi:glyoxylase-like metal-dependent hydrolase (beta-lactamase superfamily II)